MSPEINQFKPVAEDILRIKACTNVDKPNRNAKHLLRSLNYPVSFPAELIIKKSKTFSGVYRTKKPEEEATIRGGTDEKSVFVFHSDMRGPSSCRI